VAVACGWRSSLPPISWSRSAMAARRESLTRPFSSTPRHLTRFHRELDDVFGLFDSEVGQFADVQRPSLPGRKLDEGAEFFDRDHFAAIDFANLGFGSHAFRWLRGRSSCLFSDGVNMTVPSSSMLISQTGLFDDAFDVLPPGPMMARSSRG